jgi:hypothetical protein
MSALVSASRFALKQAELLILETHRHEENAEARLARRAALRYLRLAAKKAAN